MLSNKTIAVIVPAYNEEKQIGLVIETMPDFVDRIVVVNDNSSDATENVVKKYIESEYNNTQVKLITKNINRTLHNEAEFALRENNVKESDYFPKSAVINIKPETDRIILINNLVNTGVGGSIARGYKWCKDNNIDCTAVMAGDGQMDPDELESICLPVINPDF